MPRKYMKYEKLVQKDKPLNSSETETHQKYIPEVLSARKKLLVVNQKFQLTNHDAVIPDDDLLSATNNRKISNLEESNRGHQMYFANNLSKREGKKTLMENY